MKKTLAILILFGFLVSCGPRRLRCGPGRCMKEQPKEKIDFNKNVT